MPMLSSYRPVNGKTALPNKRTRPITLQRLYQAKERVQLLCNGFTKQKNASNYFATAFSRHSLDPIRFSRSVTGRFAVQPVQFEQLVELISRQPKKDCRLLRLPWHCFRAATKSRCESSLNCSSWSASFDSGVGSRCAKSNGKSSCRTIRFCR